ncbi:FMN-binding negative transcriptional regulator [Trueperella bialowiezensis]|uniref:FMN-binding negative transcriptional regulator n=1 Tax=Trueperella bialowiezensis TaxID=312285 RepID=UPI0013DF47DA|nr:FMN-binding negative transcriptional regulator [Trueperella bialowiezensis]
MARQHAMGDDDALAVVEQAGAGQFITAGPNGLNATFVPFNVDRRGEQIFLQTHLTRVNPQWRDDADTLVVVQGPQARVSGMDLPPETPTQRLPNVPTWNYVTVHVRGEFTVHDDAEWKTAHLTKLVERFESEWRVGTHSSYELVNNALAAMVGVEIRVREIVGKAKLGQNMSPVEIAQTAEHMRNRDAAAGPVADLMEDIAIPWAQAREERVEGALSRRTNDSAAEPPRPVD